MDLAFKTKSLRALALAGVLACAPVSAVEKLSVRGLFKDTAILVIDGKQRLLRAGQTSPEGVKLLSADSKQAVIEIDGVRSSHRLGADIGSGFAAPENPTVRIWPTASNMYPVVGSINGLTVDFLVDTGATIVSMNSHQARRLGIDYAVEGTPSFAQTASGIAKVYLVNLKRVKVGEIELRNVKGAVHEGDFPTVTLLGMSFLGRLDMHRQGGVLELRKKY